MRYSTSYTFHGPFRILTIILFPRNSFKSRPLIPRSESRKGKYHFDFLSVFNCAITRNSKWRRNIREKRKKFLLLSTFFRMHIFVDCVDSQLFEQRKNFVLIIPFPEWLGNDYEQHRKKRKKRKEKKGEFYNLASERKKRKAGLFPRKQR